MTKRQNQILKVLIQSSDYITSVEISNNLGISEKTVREELKIVREFLADFSIELNSRRGFGYKVICESYEDRDLIYNLLDYSENQKSDKDSLYKSLIFCFLFCQNKFMTQESLKNELFIHKRYMQRLILEFNRELALHQLEIKTYPARGYYLDGSEIKKRMAFVYHFSRLRDDFWFLDIFNKNSDFSDYFLHTSSLQKIYDDVIREDCSITEENLENLNLYLMVARYRQKKEILISSYQITYVLLGNEVKELAEKIFQLLDLQMDTVEIEVFSLLLLILSEHSEDFKSLSFEFTKRYEPILNHIRAFFQRRASLYSQLFENTLNLENKVKYYLALILEGNQIGTMVHLPDEENFDDDFHVSIEIASLMMFGLENNFNYQFKRENVFILATIINASFRYYIWNRQRIVYIQSKESNLYAQALKRRIVLTFNKLVDVRCIPRNIEVIDEVKSSELTLLITDDFNTEVHQRVMRYKSLFMYSNIVDSLSQVLALHSNRRRNFINSFKEKNFHVEPTVDSVIDLIVMTCKKYKCSRQRINTILRNVDIREKQYYSITKNGLCIPRVYVDSVKEPLFEVFIPEYAYHWNGERIHILMILILPGSYLGLTNVGRPLSLLYNNVHEIQKLSQCHNFQEFIVEVLNYTELIA